MAKIIPIRAVVPLRKAVPLVAVGQDFYGDWSVAETWYATFSQAEYLPLRAIASELADRIAESTEKARKNLQKLSNQQITEMVKPLKEARDKIQTAIMEFDYDPRNATKAARLRNLKSLKTQINATIQEAYEKQSLLPAKQTEAAIRSGVEAGTLDLVSQDAPGGWGALKTGEALSLAGNAYALVDGAAISFLTTYRLELAGTVADDLKQKVSNSLSTALINGTPLSEVTQKLGQVITDPEKFTQAGGKIFPSAANRLQLIVETENSRCHNQGRLSLYENVGIERVRWITSFARSCAECESNHDQVFDIDKVPPLPLHPACKCTIAGERSEVKYSPKDIESRSAAASGRKVVDVKKTDIKIDRHWPDQKGIIFHTDAPKEYLFEVNDRLRYAAKECKKAGIPIVNPKNGTSFKWQGGQVLGNYNGAKDRISVNMLNVNGLLRNHEDFSMTVMEEFAHRHTLEKGWFKIKNGKWIASDEMEPILAESLEIFPSHKMLIDEFVSVKKYPESFQQVELSAKMFRNMGKYPEEIKKTYPKLYDKLLSIME